MPSTLTDAPFTDAYTQQEIEFYGTRPYRSRDDTLRVIIQKPVGPLDEYFNAGFMDGQIQVPTLIARRPDPIMSPAAAIAYPAVISPSAMPDADSAAWGIWMSLTPMETQSSYLAISRATGEVGTAGLGLGYFTLRAAAKDNVETVTVFEQNPAVIKYFKYRFKHRPYFNKIKIVEGDAREQCKDYQFDFFFADVYPLLLSDTAIDDIGVFCEQNDIDLYQLWGEERIIMHMLVENLLPRGWFRGDEYLLVQRFLNNKAKLACYSRLDRAHNMEFCERYVTMTRKHTDRC
jgi:hypothetical protein